VDSGGKDRDWRQGRKLDQMRCIGYFPSTVVWLSAPRLSAADRTLMVGFLNALASTIDVGSTGGWE
jgi:hypothetical protein